jgi:hypothetical protein
MEFFFSEYETEQIIFVQKNHISVMKGDHNENKNKYRENTPDPLNKTGA